MQKVSTLFMKLLNCVALITPYAFFVLLSSPFARAAKKLETMFQVFSFKTVFKRRTCLSLRRFNIYLIDIPLEFIFVVKRTLLASSRLASSC